MKRQTILSCLLNEIAKAKNTRSWLGLNQYLIKPIQPKKSSLNKKVIYSRPLYKFGGVLPGK